MQIVVGVTKAVSDRFGKGGIADRMIWFNGFPFLDNKEERTFGVPVSHVMNQELTVIPSTGMTLEDVGGFLVGYLPIVRFIFTFFFRVYSRDHRFPRIPDCTGPQLETVARVYQPNGIKIWYP